MNIVKDVAKLLGIEVGVPFHVNEETTIYQLRKDGVFEWQDLFGMQESHSLTKKFLCGDLTVKWKPKENEKYYTVDPSFKSGVCPLIWSETSDTSKTLYDRGLVFRTQEEAAAKAKEYGWIK